MNPSDLAGLPLYQALQRCPDMTMERVRFLSAPNDTSGLTARVILVRGDCWLAGWFRDQVIKKEFGA